MVLPCLVYRKQDRSKKKKKGLKSHNQNQEQAQKAPRDHIDSFPIVPRFRQIDGSIFGSNCLKSPVISRPTGELERTGRNEIPEH